MDFFPTSLQTWRPRTSTHFTSGCEVQWNGPTTETVPTNRQVLLRCCWAPWRFTSTFTPRCFNMSSWLNPAGDDWHFITALIYTVHSSESALTHQDRLIAVTLRDRVRGASWSRSGTAVDTPLLLLRLHFFLEFTHCFPYGSVKCWAFESAPRS